MLNIIMKLLGKTILQGILWVFIFSISIGDRILFDEVHAVIVQNEIVATVDQEIGKLWNKISTVAKSTINTNAKDEEKTF